jgi:uroporphyrinogen-III decarboxylase
MMEKGAAIAIERGKFNVDLGLPVLRLNDSVANMSVISPRAWREFVLPHMRTVCDELHAYDPRVRIYCHICGNALPILEGCLEAGVDCIGPLDPLGGFTCADARAVVGDRAALMGGVNTLSFVHRTPADLIEEARTCIVAAGRDGGYILGSGCALPRSSRRENLLALAEAAERFGRYG